MYLLDILLSRLLMDLIPEKQKGKHNEFFCNFLVYEIGSLGIKE